MDITQDEFNQEAIGYLKALITGIESGKINAHEINTDKEFSIGTVVEGDFVVDRDVPTGYRKFYLRYKEI